MQQHLEVASPDLAIMRASLMRRLQQLEAEKHRIDDAIREIQRRIGVMEEVLSWSLSEERGQETAVNSAPQPHNGDARLVILPLAEAIVQLRREQPDITKRQVRERLQAVGYRFNGAVGRSTHAAWLAANRRLRADNP